jgi:hypothetical protein
VVRKVEINKRVFNGGEFELTPLDPSAVITLGRAGAAIQGNIDLLDQAKSYPRGMVTIAPQPLRPTDTPKRKYLEGGTTFAVDHLEAGRYRICAWLEEGSDVDRFLGNPQWEQKLGVSCETVNLAARRAPGRSAEADHSCGFQINACNETSPFLCLRDYPDCDRDGAGWRPGTLHDSSTRS